LSQAVVKLADRQAWRALTGMAIKLGQRAILAGAGFLPATQMRQDGVRPGARTVHGRRGTNRMRRAKLLEDLLGNRFQRVEAGLHSACAVEKLLNLPLPCLQATKEVFDCLLGAGLGKEVSQAFFSDGADFGDALGPRLRAGDTEKTIGLAAQR